MCEMPLSFYAIIRSCCLPRRSLKYCGMCGKTIHSSGDDEIAQEHLHRSTMIQILNLRI